MGVTMTYLWWPLAGASVPFYDGFLQNLGMSLDWAMCLRHFWGSFANNEVISNEKSIKTRTFWL